MNRLSERIFSVLALGLGTFAFSSACASEQGAFPSIGGFLDGGHGGGFPMGGGGGAAGAGIGGANPFGSGGALTGSGGATGGGGAPMGGSVSVGGSSTAGVTGAGGGSSCKPSYCPSTASGSPCCTASGTCGVDFGMGCTAAPKDGGTP